MRVSSHTAFQPSRRSEDESLVSLTVTAVTTVVAMSIVLGTVAWWGGLLLVEADFISRSPSWVWYIRFAAVIHLLRGVLMIWREKRKG